jgi:endonuclease/exonuclease/phosphatase (EEP) superfamily protein YafD
MNPIRILAAATAMEIAVVTAALASLGLAGARNGWLDVINSFAPVVAILGLAALLLGYWSLEGPVRVVVIVMAMATLAYAAFLIGPDLVRLRPPEAGAGASFTVLSANVWHDNPTPDLAAAQIVARNVDAVFLQESDGSILGQLEGLKSRYPFTSQCPGAGVLILSKTPIRAAGCGDSNRNLVWIDSLAPDGRPVTLVTTHFGWPFPPRAQAMQRLDLAREVHRLPLATMILAGDFNTTPWSFGMKDQDRLLAPLRRLTIAWFSWPARLVPLGRGWSLPILPIDHIYSGTGWRLNSLTRLRLPGSDHFATEAIFTRSQPATIQDAKRRDSR